MSFSSLVVAFLSQTKTLRGKKLSGSSPIKTQEDCHISDIPSSQKMFPGLDRKNGNFIHTHSLTSHFSQNAIQITNILVKAETHNGKQDNRGD